MVIYIKKLSGEADTAAQGTAVYDVVAKKVSQKKSVVVDFSGVTNVTSSFVNASFIRLLEEVGMDRLRSSVTVKGANRQVVRLIRDRVEVHAKRLETALAY